VAISLGRDCSIAFNGTPVAGVRDVTIDETASTITIRPFGSRQSFQYQTGYSITATVETIDDAAVATAIAAMESGAALAVVATGATFAAIVTRVGDAQPLDGLRAFAIELAGTLATWRQ
jgi:hypothetical protein